jgi:hypothetical protein
MTFSAEAGVVTKAAAVIATAKADDSLISMIVSSPWCPENSDSIALKGMRCLFFDQN